MAPEGEPGRQSAARRVRVPPAANIPDERRRNRGRRRADRDARRVEPDAAERAALATLDKLSRGVFLLDQDGAVTFANKAAKAMLARNDGMTLRKRRLHFRCDDAQNQLDSFLAHADHAVESLVLCTRGMSEHCPYRVLVSPLEHGDGFSVFVYEPNGGQKPLPPSVLKRLYQLTTAEAHLANELFAGKALAEAAQARGISINTAKYALKSIFSKCEVRSRAELLLLLSLGPRTL